MSMKQDSKNEKSTKKKKSGLHLLFTSLFGGKKTLSIYEEEQVQSPTRTIIRTFKSNKVSMTALIIFLIILATVIIGPLFNPVDLSFSETSQQNIAPGFDMLDIPEALNGKIQDIAIGPTFSIGVSTDGDMYIWGKTQVSNTVNV